MDIRPVHVQERRGCRPAIAPADTGHGKHFTAVCVTNLRPARRNRIGDDLLEDTQVIQAATGIGREHNAGSHLTQLGSLFKDGHLDVPTQQRRCHGKAADARTNNGLRRHDPLTP